MYVRILLTLSFTFFFSSPSVVLADSFNSRCETALDQCEEDCFFDWFADPDYDSWWGSIEEIQNHCRDWCILPENFPPECNPSGWPYIPGTRNNPGRVPQIAPGPEEIIFPGCTVGFC